MFPGLGFDQLDDLADPILDEIQHSEVAEPLCDEPECGRMLARLDAMMEITAVGDAPVIELEGITTVVSRPYQILERIGHGGMGTVFKARHTLLSRVVALKVLPAERTGQAQVLARFLAGEMEAVGALHHPNIVQASDAGVVEGRHYLVMELVDGIDLARLVDRRGPLPIADACELIRQSALALSHASSKGLVHRDVKPSNLMLGRDGCVKLLDLGLALLSGGEPSAKDLTHPGQVMGTVAYMAPEQHPTRTRSTSGPTSTRTFYCLLSGHAPFDGTGSRGPIKTLLAHSRDKAPPIRERRPEVTRYSRRSSTGSWPRTRTSGSRRRRPVLVILLVPFCVDSRLPALFDPPRSRETPTLRTGPTRFIRASNQDLDGRYVSLVLVGGLLAWQVVIRIRDKDGNEMTITPPRGGTVIVEAGGKEVARVPDAKPMPSAPAAPTTPRALCRKRR